MTRRLESRSAAWAALAVLLVATAALLYHETRGTLFWVDEWTWVLHRRAGSLSTFLDPHNQHLSLVPVVLYKLLFATFGLHSYAPYRIMVLLAHLACGTLLFVYARRRVGDWLALAAAAVLLLLGPAWENFLWPFQTAWLISLGAGIGALLMLDRRDRRGDIGACVLMGVSLASSGVGLPVALGVVADLALSRRRIRDAWIAGLPLALYVIWWIGYQNAGTSANAILAAPGFIATEASAAVSSLVGLGGEVGFDQPGTLVTWGAPLLIAAVAALCWLAARRRQVPGRAAAIFVIAFSFWALTALSRSVLGNPYSGRYIYVGVLLLLLLAVELARGWAPSRRTSVAIALLALVAIVSNLSALRVGGQLLRGFGRVTAADLGALDIARPVVAPGYVLHEMPLYPLVVVPAGDYFAAADADGDPAASPATIAADPESVRLLVDRDMTGMERLALAPATGHLGCSAPQAVGPDGIVVPPGGLLIHAGASGATVGVRRFADQFHPLGHLAPHASAIVRVPADRSTVPWRARVEPAAATVICPAG